MLQRVTTRCRNVRAENKILRENADTEVNSLDGWLMDGGMEGWRDGEGIKPFKDCLLVEEHVAIVNYVSVTLRGRKMFRIH